MVDPIHRTQSKHCDIKISKDNRLACEKNGNGKFGALQLELVLERQLAAKAQSNISRLQVRQRRQKRVDQSRQLPWHQMPGSPLRDSTRLRDAAVDRSSSSFEDLQVSSTGLLAGPQADQGAWSLESMALLPTLEGSNMTALLPLDYKTLPATGGWQRPGERPMSENQLSQYRLESPIPRHPSLLSPETTPRRWSGDAATPEAGRRPEIFNPWNTHGR